MNKINQEIENNFNNNWRNIVISKNGLPDLDQIKKELFDYSNLIDRMSELTYYISNGLLSKPNYTIDALKSQVDDGINKFLEEQKNEILNILEQNKELESISYEGKKVYKIYGNVIEKIKEL